MSDQIHDAQARRRALDPQVSFLVQAPAGSGKTELLTDRILALVTCSYELPDARFILFCRQLRPEETPEVMAQKIMETAVAK